ncbi:transcriptional regulator, GntR family [Leifsonia xyli subsp. xyli str. CTCB07]|uniref:Transcriptional regulator, GntR family n=2 Tax=Leifsonia xyli subsp. xyli TaxID=59736 RepID=Q6AHJ9_LEIXX|nr:transcriptional regulator, GntR family [Leifsonia xyli subsp. xyli str. CTCB07]
MPALTTDRRLLRNDVFEMLLERIMNGSFAPGERLKDAELTAWLRVSRTPVREALSRLAVVGLIKTAPNRFTVVAPMVDAEIAGAIAVLRRIYPDAVAEALETAGDDAELELSLLAGRLERDLTVSSVETFQRMMGVVLLYLRNQVLAETVETVHLRLIRYLSLDPAAQGLLSRERVLGFSRALCSRDTAAVRAIESLLVDAEHLLTPPVAAAG